MQGLQENIRNGKTEGSTKTSGFDTTTMDHSSPPSVMTPQNTTVHSVPTRGRKPRPVSKRRDKSNEMMEKTIIALTSKVETLSALVESQSAILESQATLVESLSILVKALLSG